jgi:hypothetical protein
MGNSLHETTDAHAFKANRREGYVQMPQKMAGSEPLPPFGASTVTAVVRAASLHCQNEEKAQKCTRNRESSGEPGLNSHCNAENGAS